MYQTLQINQPCIESFMFKFSQHLALKVKKIFTSISTTKSLDIYVLFLCSFCFTSDVRHLMSSHIGHGVVIVFRFHDVVPVVLYSNHKCIVECTICFNISCELKKAAAAFKWRCVSFYVVFSSL